MRLRQASYFLLATVALFLFFGVVEPYHLLFQELFRMFLFTADYFVDTVSLPGGMSDYLSAFLTQFFINPWAGAAILSCTITSVSFLVWKVSGFQRSWSIPLTLIPAFILTAFHCDEMAMLSADISIIAALSLTLILKNIKEMKKLLVISTLMVPVMYFAFGTISLLFIVPVIFRAPRFAVWGIPLSALCPILVGYATNLPLAGLVGGLHFYRTYNFPVMPWAAGASAIIIILAGLKFSGRRYHHKAHPAVVFTVSLLICAAGWIMISTSFRKHNCAQRELAYKYAFLLIDRKWDTILTEYEKDGSPATIFPIISHNMALASQGRLANEMFKYPQRGIHGLIPEYKLDYVMPLVLSGIHLELGLVNEAQRYAFESLQSIPFFQESARCYRLIGLTNMINGEESVAKKYLTVLSNTLFYRKQALSYISNMSDSQFVQQKRKFRLNEKTLFYDEDAVPEYLSALCGKSDENTLALQYLLCYIMLQGDINSFVEHFDKYYSSTEIIPEHYAEALLVGWTAKHKDCSLIPWNIPEEKCAQCLDFMNGVLSKQSKGKLRKQYGDTYWYYLLFNNHQ